MIDMIISKDFACMRRQLIDLMKEKRYFQCDICTGNYKINCDITNIVCPPEKAFDFFTVYFGDKCFVRQISESDDVRLKLGIYGLEEKNCVAYLILSAKL